MQRVASGKGFQEAEEGERIVTIEEVGKEASVTASQCFEKAEQMWKKALGETTLETQGKERSVFALRALALEISGCTSVICSTLAKIEHAKTESDEDPS